ncbi:MAG: hypothetical protein ABSG53_07085 [Thermoguttaceae bacterium]|jgi:hypothetical protein
MVAFNQDYRIPSAGSKFTYSVNRLAGRVRHYFDEHPEVSRGEFLLDAVRREINRREQGETRNVVGTVRRDGEGINRRFTVRPPSDDEIRFGALLAERLAVLHYERYGLWPRLRRFVFGNREVRLPELPPRQTGKG